MPGANRPVPRLRRVQQTPARRRRLRLVRVHPGAPVRLRYLGNAMQHIAHHHALLPVGIDEHHLMPRRMPGRQPDGNFIAHGVLRLLQNLLQPQPAQRHHLPVNVRVVAPPLRRSEPVVVGPRHQVARPPEIRRRHPARIPQIPAHMVAVQVRVNHIIHRVAGADIRVVDAHIGLQMRAQLLVQVPRQVAPVGMRPGPHPRVHQDDVLRRVQQKDAVVQLELPVLQRILVSAPGVGGDIREHRRRRARRRHHIDDGSDFYIADSGLVCHCRNPPD